MPIEMTDAHHHLWSLASPDYPMLRAPDAERILGNIGGLKQDFGTAELGPMLAAQDGTRSSNAVSRSTALRRAGRSIVTTVTDSPPPLTPRDRREQFA